MRAPGHGVGRAGRLKGGASALILVLAAGVAWAQGGSPPADDDPFAQARARMVEQQLAGRDITDAKILAAMAAAALLVGVAASPAAAGEGKAYGKKIQSEFGAPYGQILNSVRGDTSVHGKVVFPPAEGAKAFYEIHAG